MEWFKTGKEGFGNPWKIMGEEEELELEYATLLFPIVTFEIVPLKKKSPVIELLELALKVTLLWLSENKERLKAFG